MQCMSPDSGVLGIANGRQLLGEQRIHLGVDGDQLPQRLGSPQPHGPAGVLQGLQEGGLQLRQEGLQCDAHLEEEEEGEEEAEEESWCAGSEQDDTGSGEGNGGGGRGGATDLGQQQGEGLQQGRLHCPGEAVTQDADERSGDVDHGRPQRLRGGQLDDSAQGFSRLLLLLGAAGQDALSEDGQDARHPLRRRRSRERTKTQGD